MNEQQTKLLEKLAEKLGVTAEHLWSVLIRQAPISSALDIVSIILSVLYFVAAIRHWKNRAAEVEDHNLCEMGIISILFLGSAFIPAMVILVGVLSSPEIVAGFFNPEYWAFKQIVK